MAKQAESLLVQRNLVIAVAVGAFILVGYLWMSDVTPTGAAIIPIAGITDTTEATTIGDAITICPTGWFSYEDTEIKSTYKARDGTGVALNPNVYVYSSKPANWENERKFADLTSMDEFVLNLSMGSGTTNYLWSGGTEHFLHWALSGYEDIWLSEVVRLCGSMETTGAVATGWTYTRPMRAHDSTDWSSSALDLGAAAANTTDTTLNSITTYTVADNQVVIPSQMKLKNFNKSEVKILKFKLSGENSNTGWHTIYNSITNIDETAYSPDGWTWDSDKVSGMEAKLNAVRTTAGKQVTLHFQVRADIQTDAATANYLENGEGVATVDIYEIEGNSVLSQNLQG